MTTTTVVESGAVEPATADDLALVVFESMREGGWSELLAEEVAELVHEAAGRATAGRARRLAELLDEGVAMAAEA